MPVLPDELIVEVLSRLPVKSLLQFRCVCKSWKSLISKPYFVKLHLQRSPKNVNLLLLRNNDEVKNLSIVSVPSLLENPSSPLAEDACYLLNKNNGCRVVGSCNGLVCLLGVNYTDCFIEYWFNLWNPSTKIASKDLACLGAGNRWIDMIYRFAFGYDNLGDTYKVVAFCFDSKAKEESQKTLVKICSSSDNRWRNIDSFPDVPFDSHFIPGLNDGVYLNGTLNWLALPNNYRWDGTSTIAQLVMVSLDLGTETYTQLLLPRLDEAPSVQPTIGILMDCLCFSHDWKETTHLLIWQMKDFGVEKSWTQFMKVSYQDLQIDYFDLDYPVIPLCMYENGDVLIMATVAESQAILYHRRDNRVERTNLDNDIYWKSIVNHVESLISPCCN